MTAFFISLFGVENHLTVAQEAARAVLIFAYGLVLLRLSGPRMFGHWSALDIVISIMVGSALARTMTGGAPLIGTMVAAAVMALMHVLLAHWVARSQTVAHLVEGRSTTLVEQGRINHTARKHNKISESDLREALRQHGVDGEDHIANVKAVTLEPSGHLSVIKVEPCKPDHGTHD